MDMAAFLGEGDPSPEHGYVSHLARHHKRHDQREDKYPKEQDRQDLASLPNETSKYFKRAFAEVAALSSPIRQGFSTKIKNA